MIVEIKCGTAKGIIKAPPSKSYAHRLLISSFLSNRKNSISNVSLSNDIISTLESIKALGGLIRIENDCVFFDGFNKLNNDSLSFDAFESGSTLRFMIPISLALYPNKTITAKGTKKLLSRGLSIYEDIFKEASIEYVLNSDSITYKGTLNLNKYVIKGNISSQYITGLLFSLPLLNHDSIIEIIPPVESIDYINITLDVLEKFKIEIEKKDNIYYIKGNQKYEPISLSVEGDYSNASFFYALNYINEKNDVKLIGLNPTSIQGDKECINLFNKLNDINPTIDIKNQIDLGPIIFTLATIKNGCKITGINRLRIKESDRVSEMVIELKKFNAKIDVFDDYVIIHKSSLKKPNELLDSHNDHRIAMSLAIMLTLFGGRINNFEAINKSFPTFLDYLKEVGIDYEIN